MNWGKVILTLSMSTLMGFCCLFLPELDTSWGYYGPNHNPIGVNSGYMPPSAVASAYSASASGTSSPSQTSSPSSSPSPSPSSTPSPSPTPAGEDGIDNSNWHSIMDHFWYKNADGTRAGYNLNAMAAYVEKYHLTVQAVNIYASLIEMGKCSKNLFKSVVSLGFANEMEGVATKLKNENRSNPYFKKVYDWIKEIQGARSDEEGWTKTPEGIIDHFLTFGGANNNKLAMYISVNLYDNPSMAASVLNKLIEGYRTYNYMSAIAVVNLMFDRNVLERILPKIKHEAVKDAIQSAIEDIVNNSVESIVESFYVNDELDKAYEYFGTVMANSRSPNYISRLVKQLADYSGDYTSWGELVENSLNWCLNVLTQRDRMGNRELIKLFTDIYDAVAANAGLTGAKREMPLNILVDIVTNRLGGPNPAARSEGPGDNRDIVTPGDVLAHFGARYADMARYLETNDIVDGQKGKGGNGAFVAKVMKELFAQRGARGIYNLLVNMNAAGFLKIVKEQQYAYTVRNWIAGRIDALTNEGGGRGIAEGIVVYYQKDFATIAAHMLNLKDPAKCAQVLEYLYEIHGGEGPALVVANIIDVALLDAIREHATARVRKIIENFIGAIDDDIAGYSKGNRDIVLRHATYNADTGEYSFTEKDIQEFAAELVGKNALYVEKALALVLRYTFAGDQTPEDVVTRVLSALFDKVNDSNTPGLGIRIGMGPAVELMTQILVCVKTDMSIGAAEREFLRGQLLKLFADDNYRGATSGYQADIAPDASVTDLRTPENLLRRWGSSYQDIANWLVNNGRADYAAKAFELMLADPRYGEGAVADTLAYISDKDFLSAVKQISGLPKVIADMINGRLAALGAVPLARTVGGVLAYYGSDYKKMAEFLGGVLDPELTGGILESVLASKGAIAVAELVSYINNDEHLTAVYQRTQNAMLRKLLADKIDGIAIQISQFLTERYITRDENGQITGLDLKKIGEVVAAAQDPQFAVRVLAEVYRIMHLDTPPHDFSKVDWWHVTGTAGLMAFDYSEEQDVFAAILANAVMSMNLDDNEKNEFFRRVYLVAYNSVSIPRSVRDIIMSALANCFLVVDPSTGLLDNENPIIEPPVAPGNPNADRNTPAGLVEYWGGDYSGMISELTGRRNDLNFVAHAFNAIYERRGMQGVLRALGCVNLNEVGLLQSIRKMVGSRELTQMIDGRIAKLLNSTDNLNNEYAFISYFGGDYALIGTALRDAQNHVFAEKVLSALLSGVGENAVKLALQSISTAWLLESMLNYTKNVELATLISVKLGYIQTSLIGEIDRILGDADELNRAGKIAELLTESGDIRLIAETVVVLAFNGSGHQRLREMMVLLIGGVEESGRKNYLQWILEAVFESPNASTGAKICVLEVFNSLGCGTFEEPKIKTVEGDTTVNPGSSVEACLEYFGTDYHSYSPCTGYGGMSAFLVKKADAVFAALVFEAVYRNGGRAHLADLLAGIGDEVLLQAALSTLNRGGPVVAMVEERLKFLRYEANVAGGVGNVPSRYSYNTHVAYFGGGQVSDLTTPAAIMSHYGTNYYAMAAAFHTFGVDLGRQLLEALIATRGVLGARTLLALIGPSDVNLLIQIAYSTGESQLMDMLTERIADIMSGASTGPLTPGNVMDYFKDDYKAMGEYLWGVGDADLGAGVLKALADAGNTEGVAATLEGVWGEEFLSQIAALVQSASLIEAINARIEYVAEHYAEYEAASIIEYYGTDYKSMGMYVWFADETEIAVELIKQLAAKGAAAQKAAIDAVISSQFLSKVAEAMDDQFLKEMIEARIPDVMRKVDSLSAGDVISHFGERYEFMAYFLMSYGDVGLSAGVFEKILALGKSEAAGKVMLVMTVDFLESIKGSTSNAALIALLNQKISELQSKAQNPDTDVPSEIDFPAMANQMYQKGDYHYNAQLLGLLIINNKYNSSGMEKCWELIDQYVGKFGHKSKKVEVLIKTWEAVNMLASIPDGRKIALLTVIEINIRIMGFEPPQRTVAMFNGNPDADPSTPEGILEHFGGAYYEMARYLKLNRDAEITARTLEKLVELRDEFAANSVISNISDIRFLLRIIEHTVSPVIRELVTARITVVKRFQDKLISTFRTEGGRLHYSAIAQDLFERWDAYFAADVLSMLYKHGANAAAGIKNITEVLDSMTMFLQSDSPDFLAMTWVAIDNSLSLSSSEKSAIENVLGEYIKKFRWQPDESVVSGAMDYFRDDYQMMAGYIMQEGNSTYASVIFDRLYNDRGEQALDAVLECIGDNAFLVAAMYQMQNAQSALFVKKRIEWINLNLYHGE
ncbi:MAG: hypothetical protein JW803_00440 [Endomicrobiales bacterium]|nr:hypothetical protein [Endomicrobiales bacterium]